MYLNYVLPIFRFFECETCKTDVEAVKGIMMSEDAANYTIQFLSGDRFCDNPEFNNTIEEVDICQDFVEAFMPSALCCSF